MSEVKDGEAGFLLCGIMLPPCGQYKNEQSWQRHAVAEHKANSIKCYEMTKRK